MSRRRQASRAGSSPALVAYFGVYGHLDREASDCIDQRAATMFAAECDHVPQLRAHRGNAADVFAPCVSADEGPPLPTAAIEWVLSRSVLAAREASCVESRKRSLRLLAVLVGQG